MDDFLAIFTEKAAWPMIHVFVPAILAIYAKNIWTVIAVIYIFESVEYMVSILPGGEYWGDVGANALVSDIIMGLTGAWLVQIIGKTEYTNDKRPWYAILKYKKSYCGCYQRFQPFLHVVLAAASSLFYYISIIMDILPEDSPQEFIYFGISYIFFALLFGKDRFAAIAAILISIISIIAIFTGYTMVVSFAVVFSYFLYNKIKLKTKTKNLDNTEAIQTVQPLQQKQSNRILEF